MDDDIKINLNETPLFISGITASTPNPVKEEIPEEIIVPNPDEPEPKTKDEIPETIEEEKELTEEEKRELFIKQLKESKTRFKNVKHYGKVTISQFGVKYRKERKNKNRIQKKSRNINHKMNKHGKH